MDLANTSENYVYESTMVEMQQGIYIQEMIYKKIKEDMTMTCVKVMYIPFMRNRYRRGRGARTVQSTTTTIQSSQGRSMQVFETPVTPAGQMALLEALQNMSIHPRTGWYSRQSSPWCSRQEFASNYRARHGAIPRPTKVMRSSKTTMIKNGPKTTVTSLQTAVYQSGGSTTVRTGESVVTCDMRAPPALRTTAMSGGSEFTLPSPSAWRE